MQENQDLLNLIPPNPQKRAPARGREAFLQNAERQKMVQTDSRLHMPNSKGGRAGRGRLPQLHRPTLLEMVWKSFDTMHVYLYDFDLVKKDTLFKAILFRCLVQLLFVSLFSYWPQISDTRGMSSCSVYATLSETTSLGWRADVTTRRKLETRAQHLLQMESMKEDGKSLHRKSKLRPCLPPRLVVRDIQQSWMLAVRRF